MGGAAEQTHHQAQRLEAIAVAGAGEARRHAAQALRRIVTRVALARGFIAPSRSSSRSRSSATNIKSRAVDDAQQLTVVILLVQPAVTQLVAQGDVGGMLEEADAQRF